MTPKQGYLLAMACVVAVTVIVIGAGLTLFGLVNRMFMELEAHRVHNHRSHVYQDCILDLLPEDRTEKTRLACRNKARNSEPPHPEGSGL